MTRNSLFYRPWKVFFLTLQKKKKKLFEGFWKSCSSSDKTVTDNLSVLLNQKKKNNRSHFSCILEDNIFLASFLDFEKNIISKIEEKEILFSEKDKEDIQLVAISSLFCQRQKSASMRLP